MGSCSGNDIPAGMSCLLLYQHRADKDSAALTSHILVHHPSLPVNQGKLQHLQLWVLKAQRVRCSGVVAWPCYVGQV